MLESPVLPIRAGHRRRFRPLTNAYGFRGVGRFVAESRWSITVDVTRDTM